MILEAAMRNYVDHGMLLAKTADAPCGITSQVMWWTGRLDETSGIFNCAVMVKPDPKGFMTLFDEDMSTPFNTVTVDVGCPADLELEQLLNERGFMLAVELPIMAMEFPSSMKSGLAMRNCSYENHFLKCMKYAYNGQAQALSHRCDAGYLKAQGMQMGFAAEAVALSYTTGKTTGLYWVCSARRGNGKVAVLNALERAGRIEGAELAVLQTSVAGEPLYRKLGFREITRYRQYISPSSRHVV